MSIETPETTKHARPFDAPSVLFLTRAYPPVRGGMEKFSYELTTAVSAITRARVIANTRGKKFLPLFFLTAFLRAARHLPEFDVVHIGDPVLSGLSWALRNVHRRPTAMTVHGLDILYDAPAYQRYLRRFFRSADLYICISSYVEQVLRSTFDVSRTMVIPPGIQDTLYRPETRREELGGILGKDVSDRYILLTVGRLVRRKGVAWFVGNVLPRLSDQVIYVVVGKGPEQTAILKEAERTGVKDRVLLTGTVSADHLRVFLNTADLFIMPNVVVEQDAEGFGLVALEAATCELPVIASALQGIVDAVFDGRNGVLVEAEDAPAFTERIVELLSDEQKRRAFGTAARAFTLNRFSWETIAQRYLQAFHHLQRI